MHDNIPLFDGKLLNLMVKTRGYQHMGLLKRLFKTSEGLINVLRGGLGI